MKRKYQIYYEMTSEMQEATDQIEDKVSEFREKNEGNESEGIIKVILKALDEWKPSLTPSEREIIIKYFEEEYKVTI